MEWKKAAASMIDHLRRKGIKDPLVLQAMAKVPRHLFVPVDIQYAYKDIALPIGENQTISQPYMAAYMTEKMKLEPGDKVLDVGTGSGYQAAVLAQMGCRVFSVERIPILAQRAEHLLKGLGYQVSIRIGDGNLGWPEHAPFKGIVVAAGASRPPEALLQQLADQGRMVIPVGNMRVQRLWIITRDQKGFTVEKDIYCNFVPLVGPYSY